MWEALLFTSALSLTTRVGTSPAVILFADGFVPPPSLDSYRRLDRHHQLDGSSPLPFGHSTILSAKQGRPKGSGRSEEEWDAVRAERKEQLREALCFDKKQIDKLVRAYPAVLTCHRIIEETFVPKVAMLQERLEIDQKTAGKILSNPFVFSISATSMLQKIDILHDRFRFNTKEIEKMCRNCPTIFSISIAALDERTRYVQTRLDLTDKELAEFIYKCPDILLRSIEKKVEPQISYLQKQFEIDDKSLKEILKKSPRLLTCSIETSIEPMLAFYGALIGEKKAKRLVIESTNLLRVSLEKKLKPRLAEVQKSGKKFVWNETLIQRLARRTNKQWERYKLEDVKTVRQREREQNNT